MKHFVQRLFILATIYATAFNLSATFIFTVDGITYRADSTSSANATVFSFEYDENAIYSIPEKVSYYGLSYNIDKIDISGSINFQINKLIIPKTISIIKRINNSLSPLKIKSIEVDSRNEHYGVLNNCLYSKDNHDLLYFFDGGFKSSVTIPQEIKNIKGYAFSISDILTKISILHKCSIEEDAFFRCNSLSELELDYTDEDLTNTDDKPKYGDFFLRYYNGEKESLSVIFGKNFCDTTILNSLFPPIDSLCFVVDPANQYFSSEGGWLYNKDKTTLFVVPENAFTSNFIIPEGVETISKNAFKLIYSSHTLESITYPSTLKCLPPNHLDSYTIKINEINLEKCNQLYVIPDFAFTQSIAKTVKFPKNLRYIGNFAFDYNNLEIVSLPNSIDSIGRYAINCTQELVLPSNIKKIGVGIIDSKVIINKSITPPECEDYSRYVSEYHSYVRYTPFYETAFSSSLLIVPKGYKDVYENAPVWKEFANIIEAAPDCDVNEDDVTNAADVTAIYNYILNGDERFKNKCDVNGDKVINAADVTFIYNNILGIEGQ